MADLDSGHIFLTTLAPIRGTEKGNKAHTSFQQNIRISLAQLPTAMQSPATQQRDDSDGVDGDMAVINSPFARNKRTHLARMFVISDAIYNGRNGEHAIATAIKRGTTIIPQQVDQLNAAYLVFCADIDSAVVKSGETLPTELTEEQQVEVRRSYACELWRTMGPELKNIYSNCVGFEDIAGKKNPNTGELVYSPEGFADYLERCHVETTMPFHDYYLPPPKEYPKFHKLPVYLLAAIVIIPALIALWGLFSQLLGFSSLPVLGWSSGWTFLLGTLTALLTFYGSVIYTNYNGRKPLAPGKYDDLPSVLKALYTQQTFSNFVIDNQGASAADLHQRFGEYLEKHNPRDKNAPTQNPGVISITAKGGVSQ